MSVIAHVETRGGQSGMLGLSWPSLLRQDLSLNSGLPVFSAMPAHQQAPVMHLILPSTPRTEVTGVCGHAWLFCRCCRSELGCSCLHSECHCPSYWFCFAWGKGSHPVAQTDPKLLGSWILSTQHPFSLGFI